MSASTEISLRAAVEAEFLSLAELLDGLPDAGWDTPSLCEGWRVREVVAHLTMPVRYCQKSSTPSYETAVETSPVSPIASPAVTPRCRPGSSWETYATRLCTGGCRRAVGYWAPSSMS